MSAEWPATLPVAPQWGSWNEAPEDNKTGFKPDVGPDIERRRATMAGELCSFNLVVTGAQKTALKEFYSADLKDGVLPFDGAHFRNPTGSDVTWKFTEAPSFSDHANDLYIAAMKLRLMP